MGTFDIRQDAPGLLRAESLNITLKFERTGPTTGRVSWNIPPPAAGCTAETQAYQGILVTLDTTPATVDKVPVNGTVYNSDVTADSNLFAGDTIGTSLVVGAFYNDHATTFFDVSGLKPNTPYYVSGFPVDGQYRYFTEGVHAYSLELENRGVGASNGSQVVEMNTGATQTIVIPVISNDNGLTQSTQTIVVPAGIHPADPTGLLTTTTYSFKATIGIVKEQGERPGDIDIDYVPNATPYTISINGANAQTYQALVNEINKQFSLVNSTPQGPTPPNTGAYYWNTTTHSLYQWNGSDNILIPNVITQSTQPNNIAIGTYWLNTTTDILNVWNGTAWVNVPTITLTTDPLTPIADETYWFDGTSGYQWNGTTWCAVQTYIQPTDPSLPPTVSAGSYWLNTAQGGLSRWNNVLGMWNTVVAIQSDVDPNTPPNGTYWFNDITNTLYAYNTPSVGWNLQNNVSISETAPAMPADGKFWYVPTLTELFQWNATSSAWIRLDVIAFSADPTHRQFCDLWWNTTTAELFVWDAIYARWILVTALYKQGTDPAIAPTITDGILWFNPTTSQLSVWSNQCFTPVQFIDWAAEPITTIPTGAAWHNPTTNSWSIKQSTNIWLTVTPTKSATDINALTTGTFWFNTGTQALQQWNGIGWISVLYSTTPATPVKGSLWYNTTANQLQKWDGTQWVIGTPIATCEISSRGSLVFIDTSFGSLSFIALTDVDLFKSFSVQTRFDAAIPGADGVSKTPSWNEVGIGTDGTADERLNLANEIRYELGYPVTDVELTPQQIDYAISKSLSELRARSSIAYKREYFFMRIVPEVQRYVLSSKVTGMHKIVDVLGVFRLTSSFMSSAAGAGVYGQIIMQQLYNMGTFDLLSYHIMSEYTKLMETLFAARVTFTWNEQTRELYMLHRFSLSEEAVAMECTVERTEQDLLVDRYTRVWLRRYALATCRLMLAESRGKFATLPGAGGGITLNAAELRTAAKEEIEACLLEIENYIADRPEEWSRSDIIFG